MLLFIILFLPLSLIGEIGYILSMEIFRNPVSQFLSQSPTPPPSHLNQNPQQICCIKLYFSTCLHPFAIYHQLFRDLAWSFFTFLATSLCSLFFGVACVHCTALLTTAKDPTYQPWNWSFVTLATLLLTAITPTRDNGEKELVVVYVWFGWRNLKKGRCIQFFQNAIIYFITPTLISGS